jgi:hypothetical protein
MTTPAEQIADELAQAYAHGPDAVTKALDATFAARVEIVHEPAQPQDGTYEKRVLVDAQADRAAQFARVMPDYLEEVSVSTLGDVITIELTSRGTLPDGTRVRIVGTDRLTVGGGEVTRMASMFDVDEADALVAALRQS